MTAGAVGALRRVGAVGVASKHEPPWGTQSTHPTHIPAPAGRISNARISSASPASPHPSTPHRQRRTRRVGGVWQLVVQDALVAGLVPLVLQARERAAVATPSALLPSNSSQSRYAITLHVHRSHWCKLAQLIDERPAGQSRTHPHTTLTQPSPCCVRPSSGWACTPLGTHRWCCSAAPAARRSGSCAPPTAGCAPPPAAGPASAGGGQRRGHSRLH